MGTLKDLGHYKDTVKHILYQSDNVNELLYDAPRNREDFANHVKSHLFVEEILEEQGTFVFYDAYVPRVHTNTKTVVMSVWCICSKDILDGSYKKDNYPGNRADILAQFVEEAMLSKGNKQRFGVGFDLTNTDFYNGKKYYGVVLSFTAECFR